MRYQIPIGHSDYAEIVVYRNPSDERFCIVDKTNFIRDLTYDPNKVIVITRPRRFGKTLNLSMVHYFFDYQYNISNPDANLFANTKIACCDEVMRLKGSQPSIFLTLSELKTLTFESMLNYFGVLMSGIYNEHSYIFQSDKLLDSEKAYINKISNNNANPEELAISLKNLSMYLHKVTGKKAIICLDEYDTPIQAGFLHMYYDECINFMRAFFTSAFKNNSYLEKAILSGITRMSKESLFSGMNHARVYTILDEEYSQYFGFSLDEVKDLYEKAGLKTNIENIKEWYNGYNFGERTVYNPWSIVNCADNKMQYEAYWVNTADNNIIKSLIMQSEYEIKAVVEKLISGATVEFVIDDFFTYVNEDSSANQILNLLLTAGYLTVIDKHKLEDSLVVTAKIPNYEVRSVYKTVIQSWYRDKTNITWYLDFTKYLLAADTEKLTRHIKKYMQSALSFFDTAKGNYENFYHGMTLGFMAGLSESHIIRSNRESGDGRYDVCLIPRDKTKLGIIIELKYTDDIEKLASFADIALRQIEDKNYPIELEQYGVERYLALGIGYTKKDLSVKSEVYEFDIATY